MSHYPFSEQDDDAVILPIVLRKLVQLAFGKNRGVEVCLMPQHSMLHRLLNPRIHIGMRFSSSIEIDLQIGYGES
jgi:hypothetical protein